MSSLKCRCRLMALALLACLAPGVHAVPALQLYVEGATYDYDHESWVFEAIAGEAFKLWVIGNVGTYGPISNVRIAVVYPDPLDGDGGSLDISLTPTTTGGFGGFTDPSAPIAPTWLQVDEDDGFPTLTGGEALPSHGVYGPNAEFEPEWQEFMLGDFTLTDSPIADFIDSFPTSSSSVGQINAYEVLVTSDLLIGEIDLHFDAYDGVQAGNHVRSVFAPFSHDAGTGINQPVPAPATLALLGLGLIGIATIRRRRIQH